jgi:hypothetical protein
MSERAFFGHRLVNGEMNQAMSAQVDQWKDV